MKKEREEEQTKIIFTIKDSKDQIVRKLFAKPGKGIQRIKWDLRYAPKDAIRLSKPGFYNPFAGRRVGNLVAPGEYSVSMSMYKDGEIVELAGSQKFDVKALDNTVMPAENRMEKVAFQRRVNELSRKAQGAGRLLGEMDNKMKHMAKAIELVELPVDEIITDANDVKEKIREARMALYGDPIKTKLDIDQPPSPMNRLGHVSWTQRHSTAAPTKTHIRNIDIAEEEMKPIFDLLKKIAQVDIPNLEAKLEEAGAPYTPGRAIRMMEGE